MNSRVRIRAGGLSVLDKMLLGALDEKIAAGDQGGGMTLARVPELVEFYGADTALLVGGDLHRGDLAANVGRMHAAIEETASHGAGAATSAEAPQR